MLFHLLQQRDFIIQTTAVFNESNKRNVFSLSMIDKRLSEVASQFLTYLNDIHTHINVMLLRKTEQSQDISELNGFSNDIDAIKQHLIDISFEIVDFYEKHDEKLQMKKLGSTESQSEVRKIAIRGHKNWINYQVNYLILSMHSVSTIYRLLTKL